MAGLATAFGSGAMTNSIHEIGDADCIFAIGTNTTTAHPIVAIQVRRAVRNGATLIVANPRKIGLCRDAEIHLQQRPGTDVALIMGMLRVIVDEGLVDEAFIKERCENYDEFKESLAEFDMDFVEKTTGVPREDITRAARIYATGKPSTILYAMGITQHTHGTDNVFAIANLALATGNIGKLSSGVNPLRGQNNVQGSCDMGGLPNVFTGYQKVNVPESREKFEKAWGVKLSGTPGITLTEIFDAAYDGKLDALYLVGENPVLSDANANHVIEAIERLPFLVVQDIFLTETAEMADVVLPGSTFAEKDGTFTNTERRVQRVRKVIEPVGDSHPDWWIVCELAKRMGAKGFDFAGPREIMEEIALLTPSYAGISYSRLDREGGIQWPCPSADHAGTKFLHERKFATKNGKGRFTPLAYRPSAEMPDDKYPLVLTTDRSSFHYHTGTMTRRVESLEALHSQEFIEMNPEDCAAAGIADGDKVRVISRRGKVTARARATAASPRGLVSMTFHFHESPTNVLTNSALDPVAKITETKVCAVRVERIEG